MISEDVFPMQIRRWGARVQRANEQGQEQLGQLMKRILKYGVNKRRKKGQYLRLGKLCTFSCTATQQGMEKLCQKLDVANGSHHRLMAKQRRGMCQAQKKLEGKQLKRERITFSPLLSTPLAEPVKDLSKEHVVYDDPDVNLS